MAARRRLVFYRRSNPRLPSAPEAEVSKKIRTFLHVLGTDPALDVAVLGFGIDPRIAMTPDDQPIVFVVSSTARAPEVPSHSGSPSASRRRATTRARVLDEYRRYFNEARPHQGIGQRRPNAFAQQAHATTAVPVQAIVARPVLEGLRHDYRAAA
jgi:transposase InsO family protein